ncbi:4-hydroxy-3-methylbut-2-enyl diphosphate synthase [Prunus dulcis]|uniref:4-hydroxy-3-methylbut-2-enyl diphosphate synthase n=1 Tax=Prunus dulcis TaxID=3755 RepID=A0A4Y1RKT8_PRUDU|nr:4-hydroxy-3-methylbut-2-enyl diphosphate synthase [Prunus dulcis]
MADVKLYSCGNGYWNCTSFLHGSKRQDSSIGFAKSMDFVRVCDLKRFKSGRTRISVIRNSNSGSDIAELKPASEGSPLLVPRQKYCESIHKTVRRKTRTVMVGNVAIGSEHPIRIQTMTTTDTKDVAATVEQAPFEEKHRHYFDFQRRSGQLPMQKEGEEVDYRGVLHRDGSVLMSVSLNQLKTPELLYKSLAAKLVVGMPFKDLATVDSILLRQLPPVDDNDSLTKPLPNAMVLVNLKELSTGAYKLLPEGTRLVVSVRGDEPYEVLDILKGIDATMLLHDLPFSEDKVSRVHAARRMTWLLLLVPMRALLVDGLGDGLLLEAPDKDFDFLRNTSFNLLQGCRMRNTKTEYVSCPSCGRTLFDLQEISAQIREKTSHLPGVSIAIMGCIVNGPGEMADADFGYVGGAPGKIDLYTVVRRAIEMEHATDALIQLIKDHGRWVDPPAEE